MPSLIFSSETLLTVKRVKPQVINIPVGAAGALVKGAITQALQNHIAVLQGFGIPDLSILGKLSISGNVIPQVGLLKPSMLTPGLTDIIERPTTFSGALRVKRGSSGTSVQLEKIGGPAFFLKAEPFSKMVSPPARIIRGGSRPPVFSPISVLPIPTAYWAANEIVIADDTMIILQQPNHWFVMIANKITFGANVTFTWEKVNKGVPTTPSKLTKPSPPPKSIYMSGTNGSNGAPGSLGGNGFSGDSGPEIEVWTLDVNHLPSEVLLFGQDGFQGGTGQDGQDGQDGAEGRGYVPGSFPSTCDSGPGNGGRGGDGGSGGSGGKGGDGGHGGRFNFYTPLNILSNITSQGYYIDTKEGLGGVGGNGGNGGQGGAGGKSGNDRDGIGCPTSFGKDGDSGSPGSMGCMGAPGCNGEHFNDAEKFYPIDSNEFIRAFNKPAIFGLSVTSAICGDVVSATGNNFTNSDLVFVNDVQSNTCIVSDTLITFVVPNVVGGRQKAVYVKQQDGTESNRATLHVQPKILWIEQNGQKSTDNPPARFTPGKRVTIVGTGFANRLSIKVNDQYVDDSDIIYSDSTKVSFTLFRPSNVVPNPSGENVGVEVVLNDGAASGPVQFILDTVVIAVFGDSIQWGQGLREDLKFHHIIEQHVGNNGTIGVYKTVNAHSGATIGVGDNNQESPVNGEVPTSYPTILQQVDLYTGDPKLVDLVLIDGGINDVTIEEIVSPIATSDLADLTQEHCYDDMKYLLEKVTGADGFSQAKIIVTGYYPIVSDDSDLNTLILLLAGLGMLAGGTVGGPLGGLAGAIVGGVVSAAQKDVMVSRCKRFSDEANQKLQQAVLDVKAANATKNLNQQIFFAKPDLKKSNAIFASDSWLWGIENDLGPADDGQIGGVEQIRSDACHLVDSQEPGRTSMTKCIRASMGHPNVKGAREYCRVIKAFL